MTYGPRYRLVDESEEQATRAAERRAALDERFTFYSRSKTRFYLAAAAATIVFALVGQVSDRLFGAESGTSSAVLLTLALFVGSWLIIAEFRRQQREPRRPTGTEHEISGDAGPYPDCDLDFRESDIGADGGGGD